MEEVKFGGITRVRKDNARMTDVNFASLIERIEVLEQQMKLIQERPVLKKDKEK